MVRPLYPIRGLWMGAIRVFVGSGVDDGVEGRWPWLPLCNGIPVG